MRARAENEKDKRKFMEIKDLTKEEFNQIYSAVNERVIFAQHNIRCCEDPRNTSLPYWKEELEKAESLRKKIESQKS